MENTGFLRPADAWSVALALAEQQEISGDTKIIFELLQLQILAIMAFYNDQTILYKWDLRKITH